MSSRIPLLAAFAASLYPFVAFWMASPDHPRSTLALLALGVLGVTAACWLISRVLAPKRALAVVGLGWIALAFWVGGSPAGLGFLLTALAAVALGAPLLKGLVAVTAFERAALAYLTGLAILIVVLGIVLPVPIHYPAVYAVGCLACIAWGWRSLAQLGQDLARDWRQLVGHKLRGVSGGLALAAALLWVWGAWGGFTPITAFDDLGSHLRLPYELLVRHFYSFDVQQQVWAASPWAADLAFAIPFLIGQGTEGVKPWMAGSYHLATAILLLGLLARRVALPAALLFVLAYLSVPLVMASTHTLHTENLSAALVMAVFALWAQQRNTLALGPVLAAALLLGFLGSIKASNLAASLLLGLLWLPWFWRGPRARPLWALTILLGLATVLIPYLRAWRRTGNPVMPLFNGIFKSPYFPAENFTNAQYAGHFGPGLFQDLFLHGSKYLETGSDIVAGPALFLLLPGALILLVWRADLERRCALAVALAFSLILLSSQQYVRYIFPMTALALFALSRVWDAGTQLPARVAPWWRGWWTLLLAMAIGVGTWSMPKAFWQTTPEALADALRPGTARKYHELYAAERELNRTANDTFGVHARVLYMTSPFGADLHGSPIYPQWWNPTASAAAWAVKSDADAEKFVRNMRLTHVMLADPTAAPPVGPVATPLIESFARRNGRVVATSANKTLIELNENLVYSSLLWTLEPEKVGAAMSGAQFLWGNSPVKGEPVVLVELEGLCDDPAALPAVDVIWAREADRVGATSRVERCLPRENGQYGFSMRLRLETPATTNKIFLRMGAASPVPVRLTAARIRAVAATP